MLLMSFAKLIPDKKKVLQGRRRLVESGPAKYPRMPKARVGRGRDLSLVCMCVRVCVCLREGVAADGSLPLKVILDSETPCVRYIASNAGILLKNSVHSVQFIRIIKATDII